MNFSTQTGGEPPGTGATAFHDANQGTSTKVFDLHLEAWISRLGQVIADLYVAGFRDMAYAYLAHMLEAVHHRRPEHQALIEQSIMERISHPSSRPQRPRLRVIAGGKK
jgi:hypothetical protein